ncbi:MAG TPA: hypothetical protein ENH52_00610 [Nitrospirae bacterium]|nr:hypothetical protein [Nitrospirota bacterium]
MQTKLTLLPGRSGTKKLLRQYGDQLICVRYRYDDYHKKRYKTVELIIEETPWVTKDNGKGGSKNSIRNERVAVRIGFKEGELRTLVKDAGGIWKKEEKVWMLPYKKAVEFGLEKRIIK